MQFHEVEQNTEQWYALRSGRFTASTFANLFSIPSSANYKNTLFRVAFERLTFERPESFSNSYMKRGHELEPYAILKYETETFRDVSNGGFFSIGEWIGASPDGLVGDNGQIQVKCPAYNTHIGYLLKNKVPSDYMKQIQGELYVTGRDWCDFVSYHPNLKPLIIRVDRDEKMIKDIEDRIELAIKEVKEIIKIIG